MIELSHQEEKKLLRLASSVLPQTFLSRLASWCTKDEYTEILLGLSVDHPTTLRVNTLKATDEELVASLQNEGITIAPLTWIQGAYEVIGIGNIRISQSQAFTQGLCYIQSLSSMIPALVLQPQEAENIGDITAAPGSKTTQIAAIMHNSGHIIANDLSYVRRQKLAANLKIQGVTNTTITGYAGQIMWQKYGEYFDRVLVDVPCSMEGRFHLADPKTYEDWSAGKSKMLVQSQRFLLRSAVSMTKPGGIIVYSTCTLSPEENEGVVAWALEREKGSIEIMDIDIPSIPTHRGIVQSGDKKYSSDVSKSIRILPDTYFEGFYVAKLKKLGSTVKA